MKSCCDTYCANHGCNQGRDCPARVAPIGRKHQTGELLPPSPWRDHLKHLARWVLLVACALGISCIFLAMIVTAATFAPAKTSIDCSMASFHPDYTPAMREACRKRFKT